MNAKLIRDAAAAVIRCALAALCVLGGSAALAWMFADPDDGGGD